VCCLLFTSSVFAQSAPPRLLDGWEKISIGNLGSFDLPPTMEIQAGSYQDLKNYLSKDFLSTSFSFQIVAQQKGLNDFSGEGFSRYARIMFKTAEGSYDPELILDFDINEISKNDIDRLNNLYRGTTQIGFLSGMKLKER